MVGFGFGVGAGVGAGLDSASRRAIAESRDRPRRMCWAMAASRGSAGAGAGVSLLMIILGGYGSAEKVNTNGALVPSSIVETLTETTPGSLTVDVWEATRAMPAAVIFM